jgi:hypothetical protein
MRSAADLEDKTDKHPDARAVLPAREQLADLLLELGKPDQALFEYEARCAAPPGSTASSGLPRPQLARDSRQGEGFMTVSRWCLAPCRIEPGGPVAVTVVGGNSQLTALRRWQPVAGRVPAQRSNGGRSCQDGS